MQTLQPPHVWNFCSAVWFKVLFVAFPLFHTSMGRIHSQSFDLLPQFWAAINYLFGPTWTILKDELEPIDVYAKILRFKRC